MRLRLSRPQDGRREAPHSRVFLNPALPVVTISKYAILLIIF